MYNYIEEKKNLFTEEGVVVFLAVRDNAKALLKQAGAFRMQEAISGCGGGSSWTLLACVDRLVETKEIREITNDNVAVQHRVFVSAQGY